MTYLKKYWLSFFNISNTTENWWTRKKRKCNQRQVEIVRITGKGNVISKIEYDEEVKYQYYVHFTFLIKQGEDLYKEEQMIPFQLHLINGQIIDHQAIIREKSELFKTSLQHDISDRVGEERFVYDRRAAVSYAEHWWNSYNPKYRQFDVDCTNYVSQCLLAGGAIMHGAPNRSSGWWYLANDWSFSWAVAHSMRWYLSGANHGLTAKEVERASDLNPGDVICYDFEGDGRWDHNTIVVAKDANDMPLVNAHTNNSRHRYWAYEDSAAWTPEIKYKFFQIG